jgi:hypothetical protein
MNKESLIKEFNVHGDDIVKKNKKECIICGNTKSKEIELSTLYSDGEGKDCIEKEYICKEGKGCS